MVSKSLNRRNIMCQVLTYSFYSWVRNYWFGRLVQPLEATYALATVERSQSTATYWLGRTRLDDAVFERRRRGR